MPRSDRPLSERIQELEGEITGRVGQALAELRDSLRERLRAGEEEALRRLDEIAERIPRAVLSRQDVEPIARGAGDEGRREAWGDLLEGLSAIDGASGQAEALDALLAEARRYASRAALLLTRTGGAEIWGASGWESAELAGTRVGWDESEAWGRLAEGRGTVRLSGADCAVLCSRVEAPVPDEGVLVPLVLRDRVAAALYADRGEEEAPLAIEALQLLTWATAATIEGQPFRTRSATPTLHPADRPGEALPLWDAPVEPAEEAEDGEEAAAEPSADAAEPAGREDDVSQRAGWGTPPDWEGAPEEATAGEPEARVTGAAGPAADLEIGDLDSVDLGAEAGYAAPGYTESADSDLEPIDLEPVDLEPVDLEPDDLGGIAGRGEAEEPEEIEAAEEPSDADEPVAAVVEAEVEAELAAAAAEVADEAELAAAEADTGVEEAIEEPAEALPPAGFGATQEVRAELPDVEPPPVPEPVWREPAEPEPEDLDEPEELYGGGYEEPSFEEPADLEPPPPPAAPAPTVAVDLGATQLIDRPSFAAPAAPSPLPAAEPEDEPGEVTTVGRPRGGAQVTPPEDVVGPGWAFARGPAVSGDDAVHEEARRLARLLVSEIRLYNEEQVEEGRRSRDIYSRLREDIDRSRQMYEERVDKSVLGGTDYFQEELVRILAAGDSEAMGMQG